MLPNFNEHATTCVASQIQFIKNLLFTLFKDNLRTMDQAQSHGGLYKHTSISLNVSINEH